MTRGDPMETTPLSAGSAGEGWHLGRLADRAMSWLGPTHTRLAPRDEEGSYGAGLALPLNPLSILTLVVLMLLGLAFAAGAVLVPLNWWRLEGVRHQIGAGLGEVLFVAMALLFLVGGAASILQRVRGGRMVLLTADGVVITTDRRPVRVPWHAITAVRPHWTSRRRGFFRFDDRVRNWLTLEADPALVEGRTGISAFAHTLAPTVDVATFACDPHLALAVLRFYLDNPEERGELRSVVALDRVAAITRSLGGQALA